MPQLGKLQYKTWWQHCCLLSCSFQILLHLEPYISSSFFAIIIFLCTTINHCGSICSHTSVYWINKKSTSFHCLFLIISLFFQLFFHLLFFLFVSFFFSTFIGFLSLLKYNLNFCMLFHCYLSFFTDQSFISSSLHPLISLHLTQRSG